jgi:hypothetical protein
MIGRTECDDVASLRVRERQVDGSFGRLSTRHFVVSSWQLFARHDVGEHFSQVVAQRMVVMEAKAVVGRIDCFKN